MYKAYNIAQHNVRKSPKLNCEPAGDVRRNNPIVTSTTPMELPRSGNFFPIKICNSGVKITSVPVINPYFDAVVIFNPITCVTNPARRKKPSITPFFHAVDGIGNIFL